MLQDQFSTEQIAGHLHNMNTTKDQDRYAYCETIYSATYALPVGELRKEFVICLRQSKSTRNSHSGGVDRSNKTLYMVSFPEVENHLISWH